MQKPTWYGTTILFLGKLVYFQSTSPLGLATTLETNSLEQFSISSMYDR